MFKASKNNFLDLIHKNNYRNSNVQLILFPKYDYLIKFAKVEILIDGQGHSILKVSTPIMMQGSFCMHVVNVKYIFWCMKLTFSFLLVQKIAKLRPHSIHVKFSNQKTHKNIKLITPCIHTFS